MASDGFAEVGRRAETTDPVRHIEADPPIGTRIHVIGNSASGKSTVAGPADAHDVAGLNAGEAHPVPGF